MGKPQRALGEMHDWNRDVPRTKEQRHWIAWTTWVSGLEAGSSNALVHVSTYWRL